MIGRFSLTHLILAVLLTGAIVWMQMHRNVLSLEAIGPALSALGVWEPVGFVLIYAVATVLFFSGAILSLAGGAPFGPV
jgi:uncharacterized membrane protein YdjX (TVP38/TMEM64 family)